MAGFYDVGEINTLSRTDKMAGMWWKQKGSFTSTSQPSHIIQLQAIHQRFHQYITRHNFVSGVDNGISDRPSHSQDLTNNALLTHMDTTYP